MTGLLDMLPPETQQQDIIYDLHRGKFGAGAPVSAPREEWPGTILESEIVPSSINDVTMLPYMPGEMRRQRLLSVFHADRRYDSNYNCQILFKIVQPDKIRPSWPKTRALKLHNPDNARICTRTTFSNI